jgi:hypothetical protein
MSPDDAILAKYTATPPAPAPSTQPKPTAPPSSSDAAILKKYGASAAPAAHDPHDKTDDAVASALARYGASGVGHVTSAIAGAVGPVLSRLGVPKVLDLLDRPRQATQAKIAGKGWWDTLVHGATPEEQDANREKTRQAFGKLFNDPDFATRYHNDPSFMRGLQDFVMDTVTDPTMIGAKFTEGAKLIGLTGKMTEAIRPVTEAAQRAKTAVVAKTPQLVKDNIHNIQDRMTYGAGAKRALGEPKFDQAVTADNRQAALEAHASALQQGRFDKLLAGLSEADQTEVQRAVNGERDTRGMTPAQAAATAEWRRLDSQAGGMYATESGRRKLAYGGGKLMSPAQIKPKPAPVPADETPGEMAERLFGDGKDKQLLGQVHDTPRSNLNAPVGSPPTRRLVGRVDRPLDLGEMAPFAAPADQGLLGAENIRARHLTGPHGDTALVDPNAPASSYNLLNPRAVNAKQREAFTVQPKDRAAINEAFRNSLAQGARQGTAGRLRDELGVKLDGANDPALIDLFERTTKAKGAARSLGERNADAWKKIVNIPKNTVSTIGLKHGLVNVPALALASEGLGAAKDAYVGGAKAMFRKPEDDFAAHQAGILGGVVTPFEDRANPIADTLSKIPGRVGKVIGGASQKANRLTWAIDDAAKQAVFLRKYKRLKDAGMEHDAARDKAAAQTLREMVDYRHSSDFTNAAKNVAPFATFRSKIPAAVASSIARNPQRLLTTDRATQGLFSSGKVQVGQNPDGSPRTLSLTNPISDVLELPGTSQDQGGTPIDHVPGFKYGRSSIADPLKALLSVPGDAAEANGVSPRTAALMRYFTYGQHVLPYTKDGKLKAGFLGQSAAGDVPMGLGEDALDLAGGSDFPTPDPLSMLLGGTVGGYVR